MENFNENPRKNEVFPPIFWKLKEQFQREEPLELNDEVREQILEWIYNFLLNKKSLWENKGNGNMSLEQTMYRVNKLAQYAGVNKHDKTHVEQVMANAVFFCWTDFLNNSQENFEEENFNDLSFITDSLRHSIAALLHDVGYFGCLPRESAEFRHFLNNSTKKTYDNHPALSAKEAERVLSWVFEEGQERIRLFLHPKLLLHGKEEIPKLLGKENIIKKWKNDIITAIREHGTAEIVSGEPAERRRISRNIILADKIDFPNRYNVSTTARKDSVQQIVFPTHRLGNVDKSPSQQDIVNAAHTRTTIVIDRTKLLVDYVNKRISLILHPEFGNIEKVVEKNYLEQLFTYDERAFSRDFKLAFGAFSDKLKQILGDWDVDFSSGVDADE